MALIFCKQCCMDGSAEEIQLDERGICNFCSQAQTALKEIQKEKENLLSLLHKIKSDGQRNTYDILAGLSGGVDSSTALIHAVRLGLRPLCYSIDNGWNSPESDQNIHWLVETLKVPFFRFTIDRKKFIDLQDAFFKSGVPNIEIPTDHILMASAFSMAAKYNIKWILSGGNVATESIMPASWGYNARDLVHIKDIYKKFKGKRLNGLPTCGTLKWNYYRWIKGIKFFYLLDYINYNRQQAEQELIKDFHFISTGEKHEESLFTRWFQNFYLYEKFGIDKRKAHYASLINSGQLTREEAMIKLQERPIYPQLGIEKKVLALPNRRHEDYKMDKNYNRIAKFVNLWKSLVTFKQVS